MEGGIFPGKQNSLKQLNVTREKINNGKPEKKRKERKNRVQGEEEVVVVVVMERGGTGGRRKETHPTHQTAIMQLGKKNIGAWFLLRLLKQREIYRIELIYSARSRNVCISLRVECRPQS